MKIVLGLRFENRSTCVRFVGFEPVKRTADGKHRCRSSKIYGTSNAATSILSNIYNSLGAKRLYFWVTGISRHALFFLVLAFKTIRPVTNPAIFLCLGAFPRSLISLFPPNMFYFAKSSHLNLSLPMSHFSIACSLIDTASTTVRLVSNGYRPAAGTVENRISVDTNDTRVCRIR